MSRPLRAPLFIVAASMAASMAAHSAIGQHQAGDEVFFEQHIRPLLTEHCLKCHARDSEESGGNLFLDSRQGWAQGGDLGPAIVPGDPDASLIVQAVRHSHVELRMPPDGRLSDREIDLLVEWVRRGAPDPRASPPPVGAALPVDLEQGRRHWAFRPLEPQVAPPEDNSAWARNEIDRFLLAQWSAAGLHAMGEADRRTLIRRATFDLLGLPPSPEEVETYVADDSPDAHARLIERLLASPRYGERWARFWLDVARYADSNGADENIAHGNAWRYRDYVIRAFNRDKPFDEFLREQLAGDLLPDSGDWQIQHERTIATGFLLLGPKVLAEVDETKMEMDIIDEQVETVGRAFMGLTLGCARCHDHKSDPIRTVDYYALAGIFKSTKTMESFTKIARWNETPIPSPDELSARAIAEAEIADCERQIAEIVRGATEVVRSTLVAGTDVPADVEARFDDATRGDLEQRRAALKELQARLPSLPTAMAVSENSQPVDLRVHVRGSHLTQTDVVPRGFPAVLCSATEPAVDARRSGRLELAQWLASERHPLVARVMVNRIWRWHFGRGLVESTDDFGLLGERPVNQRLLDWLANYFIHSGWSVKQMHRLIMQSSVYRLASAGDDANLAVDPDNRLHWRANVRRLEAEAIRDAMLDVGGRLSLQMGGSLLHVENRAFLFDHTSKDGTKYDALCRSVYLPIVRNHLFDGFQLFDYNDASVMTSNRLASTVAPQALYLLNSPAVQDAARGLAGRVVQASGGVFQVGIEQAYRMAYTRSPTVEESRRAGRCLETLLQQAAQAPPPADAQSVARGAHELQAWTWLCQMLLASNEFVYVR